MPELVYIAYRCGYDAVSLRLIPLGVPGEFPSPPLGKELVRSTLNALEITGVAVHDLELFRIEENCDVSSYEAAIAVGAEMGAKKLMASAWTRRRDDRDYIVDTYGAICDLAAQYGVSVALEFPSFSRLTNVKEAAEIVRLANRPNSELLVDTLYMHMSRVDPEELAGLPGELFSFIQVSDISPGVPDTTEGMIQIARDARLYPGDGCIDFASIVRNLPTVNYSIELPNKSRVKELGFEEHARRCLKAAKRELDGVSPRRERVDGLTNLHNQPKYKIHDSSSH